MTRAGRGWKVYNRTPLSEVLYGEDAYPAPEDNPDFELFSESKQNEIEARFLRGIEHSRRALQAAELQRQAVKRARDYERKHGPAPVKRRQFAKLGDIARVR